VVQSFRKPPLCEEVAYAKNSLLSLRLKKKKTRTKSTYLSLSNDTRSVLLFKISLGKTTVSLAQDDQTATWPIQVSLAIGVAGADHHAGQSEQNE